METNRDADFRRSPAADPAAGTARPAFRLGRIISPGTPHQLGSHGLFPPSPPQQRVLTPTTRPLTAKCAEPDLLWISFAELCGGLSVTADYLALATEYRMWVIDGVPAPGFVSPVGSAAAWQRFSNVVDVLHDEDVTLFLIGPGPLDWDAAASGPAAHGVPPPVDMARIASRLSLLGRAESADGLDIVEGLGS